MKKIDYTHYWYTDIPPIVTLKDMIRRSAGKWPDNAAYWVKEKRGAAYRPIRYTLLMRDIEAIGTALLDMGLAGQRIAVMGQNSYEWIASYLAVICGLGVVVPIDKELSGPEVGNLLRTAGCSTIFCTKAECGKLSGIPEIENLIVMEFYGDRTEMDQAPVPTDPKVLTKLQLAAEEAGNGSRKIIAWKDLLTKGEAILDGGSREFLELTIDPDAMSVILFTSGTTGNPKGVMLSHRNITSNIMDVCRIAHILPTDKTLSLLPIHHTYECTLGMLLVLYRGASTAFCEGFKYISKNMKEAQNTVIIVVPRVLELVYDRIQKGIQKQGKQKLFDRTMKLNRRLRRMHVDMSRTLFKSVLDELGGKLRVVVTGAAALSPNVCRTFEDLGIVVLQGYGMTECTPLIAGTPMSADRERYKKAGSVGVPVCQGEVRIEEANEDGIGEVAYRGPNVMLGYYNMPEATAEVMEEGGWMKTGDLGFFDPDGWLYLAGRKKNVIVTKTGENVYPEELEDELNHDPLISDSMVFPYRKKDGPSPEEIVGVQILPDMDQIREKLGHEPEWTEVEALIEEAVKNINETWPQYKRIRFIHVRKEDFVRTTTRKIRRQDNQLD